ncbi:MAG: GNAT family N-acetyltransferase [Hyphomicrobiales bacterium]|nr:GNAT family N-acetyltransferase [Hyphomicrobiales bacterium]
MTLLEHSPATISRVGQQPVLRTKRLILRAPRADDATALALLINDRRIAENTTRIPHPYARSDALRFIEAAAGGRELSFLVTLADETLIGGCGIASLRAEGPEIGYWIGVRHWGRGYATEAARAVIDHAFGDRGYRELLAGARVSNPASRRVLEKCGFQWTGVVLQRILAIGSAAPCDRFRLDRGLWVSLRNWGKLGADR